MTQKVLHSGTSKNNRQWSDEEREIQTEYQNDVAIVFIEMRMISATGARSSRAVGKTTKAIELNQEGNGNIETLQVLTRIKQYQHGSGFDSTK